MKLRFRVQGQSAPLELELEPETCVGTLPLLVQEPLDTNGDSITILCGVPPKPIPDDVHPDTPISKLFREGEMLVASKRAGGGEEAIKRGVGRATLSQSNPKVAPRKRGGVINNNTGGG